MQIKLSFPIQRHFRSPSVLLSLAICGLVLILRPSATFGQQPAPQKFTLAQIEGLVEQKVPDATLSNQIRLHGLAFAPSPAILDELRSKGAGPLTLAAVSNKRPQSPGPSASGTPLIMSVTPIAPRPDQTIAIKGSGLGTHAPYTNQDTPYLLIRDKTSRWNAGRVTPNNYDAVTLSVASWSDGEIVVTGFGGAYGAGNWKLGPSDEIEVEVWNPQTGAGPAVFETQVVQQGPVGPQQLPTITLQAMPGRIHKGETTVLSWQSTDADTVTLNGVSVPPNGSQTFPPAQTITYQAVAKNQAGTASAVAPVIVDPNACAVGTGIKITVRMIDGLDSSKNSAGDRFHASLAQDLTCGGQVVVAKGADVYGRVVDVKKGRFGSEAELRLELTEIQINQQLQTVTTNINDLTSQGRGPGTGGAGITSVINDINGLRSTRLTIASGTSLEFVLRQPFTVTLNP
jgi:hypothetical protein